MTLPKTLIATTLAVLGTTAVAGAAQPSRSSDIAALERAQDRVARFADTTKGAPKGRLLLEKQRIQGLIDDLEAGRSVDPGDIDRALQRAVQP